MAGNIFGSVFKVITFGESHGKAMGGVIDGCPAGLEIDFNIIKSDLQRRKSSFNTFSSNRNETDNFEILSGVINGITLGTPIAFIILNNDCKSADYYDLESVYRPSHADYTWDKKFGIRDYKGGGRSSARETVSRVFAGSIAKMILNKHNINIFSYVDEIGNIKINKTYQELNFENTNSSSVFCPDTDISNKMIEYLHEIKKNDDTIGGVINCIIKNCPVGIGEPVFDKLNADLARAMLSINAAKGFEIGAGFESSKMTGSQNNDIFYVEKSQIKTKTNNSGGIQGGISNGEDIFFRVAFKPAPTIMKPQQTIDKSGNNIIFNPKGRHDVCFVPRAVPIVEAMAAIVIADHLLRNKLSKIN